MMIFVAALAEGVAYVPDRVFVKRCYLHGYLYPFPYENTGGQYGIGLVILFRLAADKPCDAF